MEALIKQNDQQLGIEGSKRKAWGDMGVIIYRKELELQVQAQASLSKLGIVPTKIEDILNAETALKEVKADQKNIEARRKEITSRFDDVIQRLMEHEKSFTIPVTTFANAIISVKKDHERKQAENQLKVSELTRVRQNIIIAAANRDAEFKSLIALKVNDAYTFALTKGTKPEEIEDFKDRVKFKVTIQMFDANFVSPKAQYATQNEIDTLVKELFVIEPSSYIACFALDLDTRFDDYEVAYANKKQALKIAARDQEYKALEIQQQQTNTTIAASLESSSTDLSIEPSGVKALKKSYEIDMPETFESAMKILSAFMANKQKAFEKTTVKKWFGFSADSAGKALAKLKCDDNSFTPVGVTFKEVDKL